MTKKNANNCAIENGKSVVKIMRFGYETCKIINITVINKYHGSFEIVNNLNILFYFYQYDYA